MTRIALTVLPAMLALAACQDAAPPAAQSTGASGEVLGGSIRDDMIPLDTLTSEAPTKKVSPAAAERGDAEDSALSQQPATEPAEATSAVSEVEQSDEDAPVADVTPPPSE